MRSRLPVWRNWQEFLDKLPYDAIYLGPWKGDHRHLHQRAMMTYFCNKYGEPINYLEFGVGVGHSMKIATEVFQHSQSQFFGFDTFTGLPEAWQGRIETYYVRGDRILEGKTIFMEPNTFSTNGRTPSETGVLQDERVIFIKGIVQDTLPLFLASYAPTTRMLINVDINLYTATRCVLEGIGPQLRTGDIVLFDELYDLDGEFRALNEFLVDYHLQGRFCCVCYDGKAFAFRLH